MARPNRFAPPGVAYHVVNRGNDRRVVFLQPDDYKVFLRLASKGTGKFSVDLHAHCLMPNHFHMVLEPNERHALSAYMQWVTGRYSCYFRSRTRTIGHGHVFQRRFWNVPIEDDRHFLSVVRYVEGNPLRGNLVERAEDWQWSSLAERTHSNCCSPRCESLPADWPGIVNRAQPPEVVDRLRKEISPKRGRPPGA